MLAGVKRSLQSLEGLATYLKVPPYLAEWYVHLGLVDAIPEGRFYRVNEASAWSCQFYRRQRAAKRGFVYLMRRAPYYKIGCTQNVFERRAALSSRKLKPLDVIAYFYAPIKLAAEKEMHKKFEASAIGKEWFCLSPASVQQFLDTPNCVTQEHPDFLRGGILL